MDKPVNVYDLKKGDQLAVKAPPYYKDEYVYEVTSAGDKLVRANLAHSPTVKKSWSTQELQLLIQMGVIRLITPEVEA
jgi:hypothetical protein